MLQVVNGLLPARLEKARAQLHASTSRRPPETSTELHALHLTELMADTQHIRANLGIYLDHIRVEAAMRGKLDEYERRCTAIEEQFAPTTPMQTFERLQAEATAMERDLHTGPGGHWQRRATDG